MQTFVGLVINSVSVLFTAYELILIMWVDRNLYLSKVLAFLSAILLLWILVWNSQSGAIFFECY